MTRRNRDKLRHTKWTATQPTSGEKHFVVIQVRGKGAHSRQQVTIKAVLTGHIYTVNRQELADAQHWRQGWHSDHLPVGQA